LPERGRIRVLIADDHPVFRRGLRSLLEAEAGFQVAGEAAGGAEALAMIEGVPADVLLLDLAMPQPSGMDVLRAIANRPGVPPTIVLTAAVTSDQVLEALRAGARGIILKESATELLLKCIRVVIDGEYWIGQDSVSDLVRYMRGLEAPAARDFALTPRERQVVAAVASGATNKEIAREMGISEATVKHHLTSVFDKTGVSTRLELALFAAAHLKSRSS